jgi:hypothetical protein
MILLLLQEAVDRALRDNKAARSAEHRAVVRVPERRIAVYQPSAYDDPTAFRDTRLVSMHCCAVVVLCLLLCTVLMLI